MFWSAPAWRREDRRLHRCCAVDRAREAVAAIAGHPVEADRAGEAVPARGGEPRVAASEAEADREDRSRAGAEALDRGRDVSLDSLLRRPRRVLRVLELLAPLAHPGGSAEPVDCDREVAALGETQRQLFVEAVEAADVRQDHDPDPVRLVGRGLESRKAVAVRRLENEVVVRDRRAGYPRDGRIRVELEAHEASAPPSNGLAFLASDWGRQARTQGASISVDMGATEDAAWRRQAPPEVP
jgi:hypothetical protein